MKVWEWNFGTGILLAFLGFKQCETTSGEKWCHLILLTPVFFPFSLIINEGKKQKTHEFREFSSNKVRLLAENNK